GPRTQRIHTAEHREEEALREGHCRDVLEPPSPALAKVRGVTDEAVRTTRDDPAVRKVRELEAERHGRSGVDRKQGDTHCAQPYKGRHVKVLRPVLEGQVRPEDVGVRRIAGEADDPAERRGLDASRLVAEPAALARVAEKRPAAVDEKDDVVREVEKP